MIYPVEWPQIVLDIKEANDWRCQQCGRQCRRPGELWLGWEYELTVAHVMQDYDAPEVFVAPLCVPCHFRHDAPYSWLARRRWQRDRQANAGQLMLSLKTS